VPGDDGGDAESGWRVLATVEGGVGSTPASDGAQGASSTARTRHGPDEEATRRRLAFHTTGPGTAGLSTTGCGILQDPVLQDPVLQDPVLRRDLLLSLHQQSAMDIR